MHLLIPEVQQAVDGLRAAIRKTEAEIAQLKETLKTHQKDVKTWRAYFARITGEKPPRAVKSRKKAVEA